MSSYIISTETKKIAKQMNLHISPSSNPKKKIDIINIEGKKFSIGDINYDDFHSHKKISIDHANTRRKLYHTRNHKYLNIKNTPAYYAAILLW